MEKFDFEKVYEIEFSAEEKICSLSKNARLAVGQSLADTMANAALGGDMDAVKRLLICSQELAKIDAKLIANSAWRDEDESAITIGSLRLDSVPKYKCTFEKLPAAKRLEILTTWVKDINAEINKK